MDKINALAPSTSGGWRPKSCRHKCDRCVWRNNGGCSEWNGENERRKKKPSFDEVFLSIMEKSNE